MMRFFILLTLLNIALVASVHSDPGQTDDNLPIPAPVFVQRLQNEAFEILSKQSTEFGMAGAKRLSISFRNDPNTVDIKWKLAPKFNGEGWNNTPRREIAAYKIQQLFLDPPDYVVPPVTTRCISLDEYKKIHARPKPNLNDKFPCMYGTVSAWLINVTMPSQVYDQQRFKNDKRYAYHMANMNLLSYLIDHQDAVRDNYLVSTKSDNPRVFSIDNGLSFRWEVHNFFVSHWNELRVPTLPKKSIDRLRQVTPEDLAQLGVLAQMKSDQDGVLRHTAVGENLNPDRGSRIRGETIQIGLTQTEITRVEKRLRKLLQDIDDGKWELF